MRHHLLTTLVAALAGGGLVAGEGDDIRHDLADARADLAAFLRGNVGRIGDFFADLRDLADDASGERATLGRIDHVIVIYQENWSFDSLYASFPGADGYPSGALVNQVDAAGVPLASLPQPLNPARSQPFATGSHGVPDPRFPSSLPVRFYDLSAYVPPTGKTGDIIHAFFTEQAQIDGGANDKFAVYSTNPGLVTSYYDATGLPEGVLGQQYVMCDHCYHSAFGGSFLNHQWLISAQTPPWNGATPPPASYLATVSADPTLLRDAAVTPDGKWIVNTIQTINPPHGGGAMIPALFTQTTIGDRLEDAGLSWAWYAGGWNTAVSTGVVYTDPDQFQAHHQPFNYYAKFDATTAQGQANRALHLKDEQDFLAALQNHALPNVSFIKPVGHFNEHPGYTDVADGQQHVADLVHAVQNSPYWRHSAIIVTYDEHGGRWDHAHVPTIDRWGPGVRVPMLVISPFAKRRFVDHSSYETVSVLRFIERRWHLRWLSTRDRDAGDLHNAFDAERLRRWWPDGDG